jgi:Cu(I)/Ag(I) efflux system periplasmic protein CusF
MKTLLFWLLIALSPAALADKHWRAAEGDGEVTRIDTKAKKITIRHGPLPGLDMSAMTMRFHVSDPALLEKAKAGDRIRFRAEDRDGDPTVTRIERQP